MSSQVLGSLDRRIVAALQVNGRASWRRVARVLDSSERTVTRHGDALLASGVVGVTAVTHIGEMAVVRLRCAPGTARIAASALARRPESTFSYLFTGGTDCVAEIACPPGMMVSFLLDELPGVPGIASSTTDPVLRYFRTVHEWQPGILSPDQEEALLDHPRITPSLRDDVGRRTPEEDAIIRAMGINARIGYEELGRTLGVSESTARRRVKALLRDGRMFVRSAVEPAALGLPVEAFLWIRASPGQVDSLGERLLASPRVRYAAALMGEFQLLVDVAVASMSELHDFVTHSPWVADVHSVEASLLIASLKRSGLLAS